MATITVPAHYYQQFDADYSLDVPADGIGVQGAECLLHDCRQLLEEHGIRNTRIYRPAVRGEAHEKASFDPVGGEHNRASVEDGLGGGIQRDQARIPGASPALRNLHRS